MRGEILRHTEVHVLTCDVFICLVFLRRRPHNKILQRSSAEIRNQHIKKAARGTLKCEKSSSLDPGNDRDTFRENRTNNEPDE